MAGSPADSALMAAVRVLFQALAEHYEKEIGFRRDIRRRARAMHEEELLDVSENERAEFRRRAQEVLTCLLSGGAKDRS